MNLENLGFKNFLKNHQSRFIYTISFYVIKFSLN